jgi:hypothetical protein
LYTIAFSKPYIEALNWWDFSDPAFVPRGGLLKKNMTPKQGYQRLLSMLTQWRQMTRCEETRASAGAFGRPAIDVMKDRREVL